MTRKNHAESRITMPTDHSADLFLLRAMVAPSLTVTLTVTVTIEDNDGDSDSPGMSRKAESVQVTGLSYRLCNAACY